MRKKIIGFTCGSFDLLHAGHALMLEECKSVCDFLIVGLQSDPSVDRISKNKPVQTVEERAIMLNAISYVDQVVFYNTEADLINVLVDIKKEADHNDNDVIRILGADWHNKNFTGKSLNIRTFFNSRNHKYSSSSIRERVWAAENKKRGIENG